MPEASLRFLIDQNVPFAVTEWFRTLRPDWTIQHVKDLRFEGKPDSFLYKWAQQNGAIVITYDEDFADAACILWGHTMVSFVSGFGLQQQKTLNKPLNEC
jgi:predicted nuclease of predicted toxin-antitoxin system